MKRTLAPIGSLLLLLALLPGGAWALVHWGRLDLLPQLRFSSLTDPSGSGTVLLVLFSCVGWGAWLLMTASVAGEVVSSVSKGRIRWRPPAGGLFQPAAAVLVTSLAGLVFTPGQPGELSTGNNQVVAAPALTMSAESGQATVVGKAVHDVTGEETIRWHTVRQGDDLWSLAERYYEDGSQWRTIVAANQTTVLSPLEQLEPGNLLAIPDGTRADPSDVSVASETSGATSDVGTVSGPDSLPSVPDDAPASDSAHLGGVPARSGPLDAGVDTEGSHVPGSARLLNAGSPRLQEVTVQRGDTLWALSQQHLGDATRWQELHEANADSLADPDLISPGQVLRLPSGAPGADDQDKEVSGSGQGITDEAATETDEEEEGQPDLDQDDQNVERNGQEPDRAELGQQDHNQDEQMESGGTQQGHAGMDPVEQGQGPEDPGPNDPDHQEGSPADEGVLTSDEDVAGHVRSLIGPMGALVASALVVALMVRRRWQRNERPAGRMPRRPAPASRAALSAMTATARPSRAGSPGSSATTEQTFPEQNCTERIPAGRLPPASGEGSSPTAEPAGDDGHCRHEVQLGTGDAGPVTLDLGPGGLFTVHSRDEEVVTGLLASIAVQLRAQPETAASVHLAPSLAWMHSLDDPDLHIADNATSLVSDLERLVVQRSEWLQTQTGLNPAFSDGLIGATDVTGITGGADLVGLLKASPAPEQDIGAPANARIGSWAPAVFLSDEPCSADARLLERLNISVVCRVSNPEDALIVVDEESGSTAGIDFRPEMVMPPARRALEELFELAAQNDHETAWWWASDDVPPPLASLPSLPAPLTSEEFPVPDSPPSPAPFLRLLGTIELANANGPRPSRAVKQCEEYCAWILVHPGSSAAQMTRDLLVADTTRRSNMSRLRAWLGQDPDGEPYLPDAYSGRIALHPAVSSDWEQLQVLVAGGVNRASDQTLHAALSLLRGAPLADAAPGEWRWAEDLREDMVCIIRDIGATLAEHCLARRDLDHARWAIERALAASPDDELLLCLRLRTEHLDGNRQEVERLVLYITRQARLLGVDLMDDTVRLLQEVMEGQERARLA
ncbi:LysM peptidoglycan-binding domain-containing protein [Propionibacterium sp.]|uniref:LysM peptidoglycan-binding domain-containing protein n=1 Tax=Propionibacterium sp. TaxID=1977903 RepID=UPI0039EC6E56